MRYETRNLAKLVGVTIENEKEDVSKQDCETNAAKRLLGRLKKEYPRLQICIQGDALYTTEPMMKLCKEHKWEYIFTHKNTRQKNVAGTYEWICLGEGQTKKEKLCKEKRIGSYVNHVEDTAGKTETMNVYEYEYKYIEGGKEKNTKFQWISSIELTAKNLEEMITAGRGRWMIENEGFNNQKNGLYNICHINSRNRQFIFLHWVYLIVLSKIPRI